ncbi:hypothetical protein KBK19_18420 [Microvirga sp. STR05]|uniref:DUF4252 domain-containing protein n=1 Tax=Hymenobacter duratus TaxID=2771356 RepID=A0ABR8JLM7_9BACT|nr:hypothetical protein [Hymenobacter duratus]MBD2717027.1 hypothetical protein [Hymenobacter duratus]MBR7951943.1 hypothetical protein [Microvirga sp. STR05]
MRFLYQLLLLPLLLLLTLATHAQSVTRLDLANGFRGLTFGSPLTEALNLKLVQDKGDEKIYERLGEQLHVGSFTAARIHYKFFRGQFAAVTIIVKGATDAQKVRPTFESLYGPGHLEGFSCKWQGTLVALSCASLSDDQTILAMSSLPLAAQMQQAKAPTGTTKLKIKQK